MTTTRSTTCSAELGRWRPRTGSVSRSMPPPKDPFSRFGARARPRARPAGRSATVVPADGRPRGRSCHRDQRPARSRRRSRLPPSPKGSRCGRSRATSPTRWWWSTSTTAATLRASTAAAGMLGVTRRAIPSFPTAGITDWIVLPASIAHIRTKLRAAVLRKACRWLAAPVAPDEERRLAALHAPGRARHAA